MRCTGVRTGVWPLENGKPYTDFLPMLLNEVGPYTPLSLLGSSGSVLLVCAQQEHSKRAVPLIQLLLPSWTSATAFKCVRPIS